MCNMLRSNGPTSLCQTNQRGHACSRSSKGHNLPRESPRKFASKKVLRGLCGGLFEGSALNLRVSEGSDPMLVTLRNCWRKFEVVFETVLQVQNCEKVQVKTFRQLKRA